MLPQNLFTSINKLGIIFFKDQRQQLITYGVFKYILKKSSRFIFIFLMLIPSFFLVTVMRIASPFVMIRLGKVSMDRIGNVYHVEWYLCERDAGKHGGSKVDIFYFIDRCSNLQWIKMVKRNLLTFPFGRLAQMVDSLNRKLPDYESHVIPMIKTPDIWVNNNNFLFNRLNANLHYNFTPEEEIKGRKELSEIVPEGQPFICFHVRDSAYLDKVQPNRDWSYHNFRDSSLQNYLPLIEQLVERGYSAFRMGAVVKEKLITTNPGIINYAENGERSDFMDIYLSAKCKFFLGSDTGLTIVPEMFKRPVVYVNWPRLPTISTWTHTGLVIPKKLYSKEEQRILKYSELLEILKIGWFFSKDFQSHYEFIENTPEEITAVALEMDDRLKGEWEENEEDEELQSRFWALFGPEKLKSPELRMGAEFLRQNQDLLEA